MEDTVDVVIEACGASSVVREGVSYLRPGGIYLLVGMVHPDSQMDLSGEMVIRKCLTIKGTCFTAGCWRYPVII